MLAATRDIVIGVCFGVAALTVLYAVGWLCGHDPNWGDDGSGR